MDIRALAEKLSPYVIERRRFYHAHPELSMQEWCTTASLAAELREMGYAIETFTDYPGLIATLETGLPGRTLMLRADIDALPVQEGTGLPFASEEVGLMHACGHDNHIAMLLGAAKILQAVKNEIPGGRVKLIFQSGEELGCGARYYVEHGCLEGVDAIFGMHVWGSLEAPYLSVEPGNRMASTDNFEIVVKGVQSHGAAPQEGRDAIVAASAIVMALQTFVSRRNDPRNPLVVSVGKFHGGEMYNIICPHVELVGTVRTYSPQLRNELDSELRRIAENTARAYGCEAEVHFHLMHPAMINDDTDLNAIARNAALKLFGPEGLKSMPGTMSGEDFALFAEQIPAFFAFLGTRNNEKGLIYTNHNEKYSSDEECLYRGAALYAQFAFDYLSATE